MQGARNESSAPAMLNTPEKRFTRIDLRLASVEKIVRE